MGGGGSRPGGNFKGAHRQQGGGGGPGGWKGAAGLVRGASGEGGFRGGTPGASGGKKRSSPSPSPWSSKGAQFTTQLICFTGTKVQILTQKALLGSGGKGKRQNSHKRFS
jgi:hypothetical protein